MNLFQRLLCIILLLALSACETLPERLFGSGTARDGDAEFRRFHRQAAESANTAGDYAMALAHYRALQTLAPEDAEILERVGDLEKQVEERVARLEQRAQQAYGKGDSRVGDRLMLDALALDPGNTRALALLRNSASQAASAEQEAKLATEQEPEEQRSDQGRLEEQLQHAFDEGDYASVIALSQSAYLNNSDTNRALVARSHIALADRAGETGAHTEELRQLAAARKVADTPELARRERELRQGLADELLREGMANLNKDLETAITQLEKATRYDPENLVAQEKLKQALTIKKNLDRIRGG
jgi:hypothetical protein